MDDNRDLLARLLMGQGHGQPTPSPLSRLMNETIIPSQNPPQNDTLRALLGDRSTMNLVTPLGQDNSMAPSVGLAMQVAGGPALRAVPRPLPTDIASRWARAAEQGFTIDAYKGMNPYKPDSLPDLNWKGQPINGTGSRVPEPITEGQAGRFYSSDPAVASHFAEVLGGQVGNASVFPVKMRMQNPKVIDANGEYAANFQFGPGAGRLKLEPNSPHDGVILRNTKDEGDIFIPRHDNQVRSRWAMFDPEQINSKSLLASLLVGLAPAAVGDGGGGGF